MQLHRWNFFETTTYDTNNLSKSANFDIFAYIIKSLNYKGMQKYERICKVIIRNTSFFWKDHERTLLISARRISCKGNRVYTARRSIPKGI